MTITKREQKGEKMEDLKPGEIKKTDFIPLSISEFQFLVHDDDLHEFESSQVYRDLCDWLESHKQ